MDKEYYRKNRERLIKNISEKHPDIVTGQPSIILLKGSFYYPEYDADTYYCRVKYEENIQYLFGIQWEDIDVLINLQDGKTKFIVPNIDLNQQTAQDMYGVDRIITEGELLEYLKSLNLNKILLYDGIDTYSKRRSNVYDNDQILKEFESQIERNILYPLLNYQRCIKQKDEINRMADAVQITSNGHIECMKNCRPGIFEYQISGIFERSFQYGAEDHAYSPICGANKNGSYLHYMVNNDILQNGQLILCDMGCKKEGVCSDITCTYPINGKFTDRQEKIYNIVLKAQRNGIDQIMPGLAYNKIQYEGYMIILQGLKELNILKGDIDQMYSHNVHKIFMPHHLGHFIGYRTHDVGPPNDQGATIEERKQFKTIDQCIMEVGMTFTVEPGIYFIDVLINGTKKDVINAFFNYDILEEYRKEVGGIRIEDNLVVTQSGYLNFTKAPRTVKEIEDVMAQN